VEVHALILTAVYSRHMFVHLTYGQTLADVIAGCEAAWSYFGGSTGSWSKSIMETTPAVRVRCHPKHFGANPLGAHEEGTLS